MIRLSNLLKENFLGDTRLSLAKITVILEKLSPELAKEQATTLTELLVELTMMTTQMNAFPYTNSNANDWRLVVACVKAKAAQLCEEICKIAETKKDVNFAPLIKAINEVFEY